MKKNIVLTGFMMAGKTQIGAALSKLTGRIVADSDEEIVRKEGRSINEIFKTDGEEYFRKVEHDVICALAGKSGIIISTGGGAVLNKKNIEALRKTGIIVNIKITPEVIAARLKDEKAERPIIKDSDLEGVLKRLEARAEYYADCDYSMEVSNERTAAEHAEMIVEMLKRNGEI